MVTSHRRRGGSRRMVRVLPWLLVAAFSELGHGIERPAPAAGDAASSVPATRLHLAVHRGRLSVDLWDAEVAAVLAWLGQAAGVLITGSPASGGRVSTQFTNVEPEVGLRRLLRLRP